MILSEAMPTYSLSVYEMTIFRNSIQSGSEFYCLWRKSHQMISWKGCTHWEYESLTSSRPFWNCVTWRFIRRSWDLIITDWKLWRKEVSSKKFEIRILVSEMKISRKTPWSRIREQNSVYKEFLEIVGSGKPTGSVWKETIAVSATILISVEKLHHQIRLRILSCGRMSENHRGPEVPEEKVPVVECLDGLARITSKELAITHFVRSGTLQNACSTRPRVVVGLGKSAHTHTVRLMNSRLEGPKRRMTKVQWLCWRKVIGMKEDPLPTNVTIDRGNLGREVIGNWDKIRLFVNLLVHDNWVAFFRTRRRRSLFSGRALTCRNQSNVWNSQRLLHVIPKFETKILRSVILCPSEPHRRSPNAPKFEDRSQEETEWQEQGAREAAWKMAKMCWY